MNRYDFYQTVYRRLPIALILLWGAHTYWQQHPRWASVVVVAITAAFLLTTAVFLFSRWKTRETLLDKLFFSDHWMSLIILIHLAESFRTARSALSLDPLVDSLSAMCLAAAFWIYLRRFETKRIQETLSDCAPDQILNATGDAKTYALRTQHMAALIGFFLVAAAAAVQKLVFHESIHLEILSWAVLPVTIPVAPWLVTRLLCETEKRRLSIHRFKSFLSLNKIQFAAFQGTGVVTQGRFDLIEHWMKPTEVGTKEEISDVLHQMLADSKHPFAGLIKDTVKQPRNSLIQIKEIEEIPHLGIKAHFEDIQGKRQTAVLGNLAWHKILQHNVLPQHLETIKHWKSGQKTAALLAIQGEVVAGFAFETKERDDLESCLSDLKKLQINTGLFSSESHLTKRSLFDETAEALFPVERDLQIRRWLERTPQILEIRAYWDAPSFEKLPSLAYCLESTPSLHSADFICLNENLRPVTWLLNEGRQWRRRLYSFYGFLLLTVAFSLFLPSLIFVVPFVFMGFLLCLLAAFRLRTPTSGQV